MDYSNVLKYQESLIEKYKYKPLPRSFRWEALRFYNDNLPERFCLDGANEPLFTVEGLKLCNRYNRVVIGDYGAYVEILPEDILHENIKVKEGQEYRDYDERYSQHTKYSWLTSKDGSDIKIYFQKKKVDYADYIPGRYYISPYECSFSKVYDKGDTCEAMREKIESWLALQGESSKGLVDYYVELSDTHSDTLLLAMEKNIPPYEFEYWVRLNEICELEGGLSFEQFSVVRYNLSLIHCSCNELKGRLPVLSEDVRTAIKLGLEEFTLPYEAEALSNTELRTLLNMSCDDLLKVSRLSKILAGCKRDFVSNDIESVISSAAQRSQVGTEEHNEREPEPVL